MSQQYEKKELRQHIFDTPDTYVGGIEPITIQQHILKDNKSVCMLPEKVYTRYERYFRGKKFIKKEGESKKGIFSIYQPSRGINGLRRVIAQRFLRCALNDDALALP